MNFINYKLKKWNREAEVVAFDASSEVNLHRKVIELSNVASPDGDTQVLNLSIYDDFSKHKIESTAMFEVSENTIASFKNVCISSNGEFAVIPYLKAFAHRRISIHTLHTNHSASLQDSISFVVAKLDELNITPICMFAADNRLENVLAISDTGDLLVRFTNNRFNIVHIGKTSDSVEIESASLPVEMLRADDGDASVAGWINDGVAAIVAQKNITGIGIELYDVSGDDPKFMFSSFNNSELHTDSEEPVSVCAVRVIKSSESKALVRVALRSTDAVVVDKEFEVIGENLDPQLYFSSELKFRAIFSSALDQCFNEGYICFDEDATVMLVR